VPVKVKPVPRLRGDIEALTILCNSKTSMERIVIPKELCTVVYAFVDSAGAGYGALVERPAQGTKNSG